MTTSWSWANSRYNNFSYVVFSVGFLNYPCSCFLKFLLRKIIFSQWSLIWFLVYQDRINSAFLTDRAQGSIKIVYPSIQHDTKKFNTTHSNSARKEAKENLSIFSGSLLIISLLYTILLFLYHDINIWKPNQSNKKLHEFMSERPWFDSTILLRV